MHLVSRRSRGTATIEMLLYDNLIAGAANEAEETKCSCKQESIYVMHV